jgi:hypothetical protein
VEVKQVVKAGKGVSRCVDPEGVSLGEFGVEDGDGEEVCECVYANREGEWVWMEGKFGVGGGKRFMSVYTLIESESE